MATRTEPFTTPRAIGLTIFMASGWASTPATNGTTMNGMVISPCLGGAGAPACLTPLPVPVPVAAVRRRASLVPYEIPESAAEPW